MASCDVCRFLFNDTDHLPLFLQCGHTYCRNCVIGMSGDGECTCPVDKETHPMNDVNSLRVNRYILSQVESVKIKCSADDAEYSTRFCKVHFRMLCDNCVCAMSAGCEFLGIEEPQDIKHILVTEIEKCPKDLLSPNHRQRLIRPMGLELRELVTLLAAANNAMEPLACTSCREAIRFIDRANVELYCGDCGEALKKKDPEFAASLIPYVEDSHDMRNALRVSVQQRLRSVDFHTLSREQIQWLKNNEMPFRTFYRIAKELFNLPTREPSELSIEKPLPDTFHCPGCSRSITNQEYVLKRLPCRFAFHAICEICALGMINKASLQCPIDGNCFYTSVDALSECSKDYPTVMPPIDPDPSDRLNFIPIDPLQAPPPAPPIPIVPPTTGIVGSGMYLVHKGEFIPPFVVASWLPENTPKDKLVCANRYFTVLPSLTEDLRPPTSEELSFLASWLIDRFVNQVEALTLLCFESVKVWGLGLANPTDPGKKATVQSVKVYQGDEARGDFKEMTLVNKDLLGSAGVITDIYFTAPYQLTAFNKVTLKIKLVSDSAKSTYLFHGNHIGRLEDLIGTDGIGWDTFVTLAVEDNESNSGQQHFIGPILRVIYEHPNE